MADELKTAPTAATITLAQFHKISKKYPEVLETVYRTSKVKDASKRDAALELDAWRYDQLPAELRKNSSARGITKDTLEKLVLWKITHGTHRPFLPSQIRKNDPATVLSATAEAHSTLLPPLSDLNTSQVRSALDQVCILTGVGPATGTLILSIFHPASIPFFSDELYAWLHPESEGKLKYNVKEYYSLFERAEELRRRLLREVDEGEIGVESWEVEKVGFVVGHWDRVEWEVGDGVGVSKQEVEDVEGEKGGSKAASRKRKVEGGHVAKIARPKIEDLVGEGSMEQEAQTKRPVRTSKRLTQQ